MNLRSLRLRLSFWYAVSLIIGIGIIFTSFYFVTQRALYTETENALTSHSEKIIQVVTSQANNMHDDIARESFVREFSDIPGMLVIIIGNTGAVVSSSQTLNPADPTIRLLYDQAAASKKFFFTNKVIGSEGLRFLVTPLYQGDKFLGVVVIGHPIQVIQSALASLTSALIAVFLVFLIPAILGGYLNARGAIAPIAAISKKLARINSGNLSERVVNPRTGDEIEELSLTFNSLLDRIEHAFERERQFIGDVAHELKTPLAAQRTSIEVALSKNRSVQELRETLAESLADNNRLSSTLKHVLDLAWAESDRSSGTLVKVNVSELVTELREIASRVAVKKKITVTGSVEPNVIVLGKKDKLFGAILNIIDNAVSYTPENGTIAIGLARTQQAAVITVRDTGIGIPRRELPHIFERFYRGSRASRAFGSGLGLAIANAAITAIGGTISVKSSVGRGTAFTITIPFASS